MLVLFHPVLDWKCPFWVHFFRKIKMVSFSWSLVLKLIWIWRNQWWCSFFLFSFLKKFVSKNQNGLFKLKLRTYNQGQNIWHKLQISCKIAHYGKSSIFIFKEPFASIKKYSFWEGGWELGYNSMKFWEFPDFS